MMAPKPLAQLLAVDPLAPMQTAIIATLKTLNPDLSIIAHPGKVDISELVSKSVVRAPGIGLGWSKVRTGQHADGHYYLATEWVAYIVTEAHAVGGRRVEKEALALAIGGRLLEILADDMTAMWGRTGVLPPETSPPAELKPLFTIRDASQGTAYYTVTWTQIAAELGDGVFPDFTGRYDEDAGGIIYPDHTQIDALAPWIPAKQEPDDA